MYEFTVASVVEGLGVECREGKEFLEGVHLGGECRVARDSPTNRSESESIIKHYTSGKAFVVSSAFCSFKSFHGVDGEVTNPALYISSKMPKDGGGGGVSLKGGGRHHPQHATGEAPRLNRFWLKWNSLYNGYRGLLDAGLEIRENVLESNLFDRYPRSRLVGFFFGDTSSVKFLEVYCCCSDGPRVKELAFKEADPTLDILVLKKSVLVRSDGLKLLYDRKKPLFVNKRRAKSFSLKRSSVIMRYLEFIIVR